MARLRNLIRALLVTLLLIAVVVPVGIYIVMSTPWAQDKLKDVACDQLTTLLGTPVEIGPQSIPNTLSLMVFPR